jgi:hypothetical protein
MNTGDKNTKGRAILKGPKGGLYVVGPTGTKLRTFTKATAPRVATPPTRSVLNNAKAHMNTLKTAVARKAYVRTRATNMTESNWVALGRYKNTLNYRASAARAAKKAGGAPPRVATPPMSAALIAAITHLGKLKTPTGRARHVVSLRNKLSVANYAVLERRAINMGVTTAEKNLTAARMAHAPRGAAATAGPRRATSATPRITTAERNVRLAAIRARLNAMRAARVAAMPKRRANVDKRLKNAVARVRLRLAAAKSSRLNNPVRSTLDVPFCYATASVPRKPCKMRKASVPVYTSPLIDDGTVVATRASDIDLDWFKRQDKYVKNLSDYDFWTAQAHTNRSHSWIGPFLYEDRLPSYLPGTSGKHIAPLWPQVRKMILDGTYTVRGTDRWRDAWIEDFKSMKSEKSRYELFCRNSGQLTSNVMRKALEMYRDDLKRIIAGAPKSRKKMILYRGASFDIFRASLGHWHTLTAFCSAAYNFAHSIQYGSTIQRITVLPGSPVLLVAGMNQWDKNGEYEIMVNIGTKYLIRTRNVRRAGWSGNRHILRVTDVTIAK